VLQRNEPGLFNSFDCGVNFGQPVHVSVCSFNAFKAREEKRRDVYDQHVQVLFFSFNAYKARKEKRRVGVVTGVLRNYKRAGQRPDMSW
jgi:hypothetical protein